MRRVVYLGEERGRPFREWCFIIWKICVLSVTSHCGCWLCKGPFLSPPFTQEGSPMLTHGGSGMYTHYRGFYFKESLYLCAFVYSFICIGIALIIISMICYNAIIYYMLYSCSNHLIWDNVSFLMICSLVCIDVCVCFDYYLIYFKCSSPMLA